jgi:hypothetical protein
VGGDDNESAGAPVMGLDVRPLAELAGFERRLDAFGIKSRASSMGGDGGWGGRPGPKGALGRYSVGRPRLFLFPAPANLKHFARATSSGRRM